MKHIILYHNPEKNPDPVDSSIAGQFRSNKECHGLNAGDAAWVFSKDSNGTLLSHYYEFSHIEKLQHSDRPFQYAGKKGKEIKMHVKKNLDLQKILSQTANFQRCPCVIDEPQSICFLESLL
ncbi:MAG: hypothetical protein ACSHYA_20245 [Opitutaceae bacterium]